MNHTGTHSPPINRNPSNMIRRHENNANAGAQDPFDRDHMASGPS